MPEILTAGRRVDSVDAITECGDYYLNELGTAGVGDRSLWFQLPRLDPKRTEAGFPVQLQRITEPPWTFYEMPDGSIEVRASILVYGYDNEQFWHGYLNAGHVWRELG